MQKSESDKIMSNYLEKMGFTPSLLELIGTISVYAATIEFWIERVIWNIEGISPVGIKPRTEGKAIIERIKLLNKTKKMVHCEGVKEFVENWCQIAQLAFEIRNIITHGYPVGIGDGVSFLNHLRWEGEFRKKEFSEFSADDNSLRLLMESFAVLARSIIFLEKTTKEKASIEPETLFTREFQRALSTVRELRYQANALNSEKY